MTVATPAEIQHASDRTSELKAFDETKVGVKGLVDAGITHVPRIFIKPQEEHFGDISGTLKTQFKIPIVDLDMLHKETVHRHEIVEEVCKASETFGFFQVINHGIPVSVLKEIMDGAAGFFEQEPEVTKEWYTRDISKPFVYNSNFNLFRGLVANWRDSALCYVDPNNPPSADDLPEVCRYASMNNSNQIRIIFVAQIQLGIRSRRNLILVLFNASDISAEILC